jgi:hypothetical protein
MSIGQDIYIDGVIILALVLVVIITRCIDA